MTSTQTDAVQEKMSKHNKLDQRPIEAAIERWIAARKSRLERWLQTRRSKRKRRLDEERKSELELRLPQARESWNVHSSKLDALPYFTDLERARVRALVLGASLRHFVAEERLESRDLSFTLLIGALWWSYLAAAGFVEVRYGYLATFRVESRFFAALFFVIFSLGPGIIVTYLGAALVVLGKELSIRNPGSIIWRPLSATLGGLILVSTLFFSVVTTWGRLAGEPPRWYTDSVVLWLVSFPIILLFFQISNLLEREIRNRVVRPHDDLLLELLNAAWLSHEESVKWFDVVRIHKMCASIETAARVAEKYSSMKTRIGSSDRATYLAIRADMRRIAAILRMYKPRIVRASSPTSWRKVSEALCSGIVSLVDEEWDKLTENAPNVYPKERLIRLARMILPAIVLGGAAWLLPLLPGLHEIPAVTNSLRITLFVSALLALVPDSGRYADRIHEVLERALPWPK